jgi:hypothetical protein
VFVVQLNNRNSNLLPPEEVDGTPRAKREREMNWELICVQEAAVDLVSIQGGIRLEVELEIEGVE